MSSDHHRWRPDRPPPLIQLHSLAKHRVLREYLSRYVATLTRNLRHDGLCLTVVDGFAGGNIFRDPGTNEARPGSPSIILDTLRAASIVARERRVKPFHFDDEYFFVEKLKVHFDSLKATLLASEHSGRIGEGVKLIHGGFHEHAGSILKHIKARAGGERAIYLLDQFGYSDVPFDAISEILATLKHAEVILTFASDSLINYLSGDSPPPEAARTTGINVDALTALKAGSETRSESDGNKWRREIQLSLHADIQQKTGARFYTPFFIHCRESRRDYWLIHLSGHYRAKDVMLGLHWQLHNSFAHFGKAGLNMFGFDPKKSMQEEWLPGYYFDATAEALTLDALREDLPRYLFERNDDVDFRTLFSELSNGSPATTEIFRDALRTIVADGLVSVRDKSGLKVRRGVREDTDIITITKQKRLFLP